MFNPNKRMVFLVNTLMAIRGEENRCTLNVGAFMHLANRDCNQRFLQTA